MRINKRLKNPINIKHFEINRPSSIIRGGYGYSGSYSSFRIGVMSKGNSESIGVRICLKRK
jgi:stress-induced morphogen